MRGFKIQLCLKCNKGYTSCTSIPLAWVWPQSFRPKIPRLWKLIRKKTPYHLGFQKKNIEMLSVVQCNIPNLLTRFIRKYCKILHNSSACKLPFVSSKRSFRLIMLTPIQLIDCPSPKSLNRKGIKGSKAEVERFQGWGWGSSSPHWPLHLRQARSVASKKDPADVTQRSERMMMTYRPCFSVLFGQCFTLCTKKTFKKKILRLMPRCLS